MGRPFGKLERRVGRSTRQKKSGSESFKIKVRGQDDAPLTIRDSQQGLLEVIGMLKTHEGTGTTVLASRPGAASSPRRAPR